MKMSNIVYDTLRLISLVYAPIATCAMAILAALDVPYLDTVAAIVAAIGAMLGSFVEISRREYMKDQEGETDEQAVD